MTAITEDFCSVYGPVKSWRYGRSLGIDPIGPVSTCSFDCVYCQLGEIEDKSDRRRLFIPTAKILEDLQKFAPWDVDMITLSGSGEPTLALNLGEIIQEIQSLTHKPVSVLTNGTPLTDRQVREELGHADYVSLKIDAMDDLGLKRVNRIVGPTSHAEILQGIREFCGSYRGNFGFQTMILRPWTETEQQDYIAEVKTLKPYEIQLNTPSRPKPIKRQLDGRGNHDPAEERPYEVLRIKCVAGSVLAEFAQRIEAETGVKVRYAEPQVSPS